MRKHPIAWFYILAFGISWLGMISTVLASRGIAPFDSPYFQLLFIFYAISPALAALIVAQVTHGKTGIRDLNKGLIRWRVGLVWFISIAADAFIYTWIYNSTNGSILLVALFHGSLNLWGLSITGVSPVASVLLNCVVAIALIAVLGKTNLSRQERVRAN